jgi:hypothetical protein
LTQKRLAIQKKPFEKSQSIWHQLPNFRYKTVGKPLGSGQQDIGKQRRLCQVLTVGMGLGIVGNKGAICGLCKPPCRITRPPVIKCCMDTFVKDGFFKVMLLQASINIL